MTGTGSNVCGPRLVLARVPPASRPRSSTSAAAPGVHAAWLAERGHRVTLIDAMPEHVEQALAQAPWRPRSADARALPAARRHRRRRPPPRAAVPPDRAPDRPRALTEARRVLRPVGPAGRRAVTYAASLLDGVVRGWLLIPCLRRDRPR